MSTTKITTVVAKNSIDFIRTVFQLYENKKLFAVDRTGNSLKDFKSLVVKETVYVDDDHGWLKITHKESDSNEPAQIVFTSGTEGKPKAILLSYKNLADVTQRLIQIMGMDSEIREYIGIPVTYSFGLGRCRAVAAAGGAFYIPAYGFNPLEIREMLQQDQINAISAVPSLWRVLLDAPEMIGNLGKKVRWIEIGSQFMAAEEKQLMRNLFPEAKIIQHYGLTEASRATFLDISSTDGELLDSVGCATGSVSCKISAHGNICISGGNVACSQLDEEGNIIPLTYDNGWLRTMDIGTIKRGYLWYLGRADDQINIGGIKLSPEQLEQNVTKHFHCLGQVAFAGVTDKLRGMKLLFSYRKEVAGQVAEIEQYLLKKLQEHGVRGGNNLLFFPVAEFPVTETGKVQRKKLAAHYEAKNQHLEKAVTRDCDILLSADEKAIASLWCEILGPKPILREDNFIDIGGDSLTTLQVIIKMERKGYSKDSIQSMLRGHSLAEIAKTISRSYKESTEQEAAFALPPETVFSWSLNALRGVMVCIVLLGHWGPGVWERLFAGYSASINAMLNPLYRMGTPGFAITFGIGVGYYFIDNRINASSSFSAKRIRAIFAIVFYAWLFLGGLRLSVGLLEGHALSGLLVGHSFYNILCYYLLAIASIPLWRRLLGKLPFSPFYSAVGVAFLFWILNWVMCFLLPSSQLDSILELPRLMFTANYAYFRVSTAVFLGIALGCWLRNITVEEAFRKIIILGLCLFFFSLLVTLDFMPWAQMQQFPIPPLSMVLVYFGLANLLLSCLLFMISRKKHSSLFTEIFVNILIVIGVLALPLYAFHGAVIPVKDIFLNLGVPSKLALILPMGAFLVCFLFGGRRLYKLFFHSGT